jgi:hypothetical protein
MPSPARTLKDEIDQINQQYRKERQAIHDKYQRQAWADWLRRKATEGDSEALAALRAREAAQGGLQGNTIAGNGGQQKGQGVEAQQDGVTKKGTIIYRVGASAIRDDGDKLQVSRGATQDGLAAALRMAMARYGNRITVNGSAEFKESIAHAAATANLAITFNDAALEQRRQTLLNEITAKENRHDASARTDRGRADRGRTRHPGASATHPAGAGRRVGSAAATRATRKPDVGRVGRQPPPAAQNRLRSLSQLGLVRIASGSEVLLPGHVPDHLEHPGAQPDDRLRRGLARPGVAAVAGRAGPVPASAPSALAAVDKYIAEREEKRLKIFDIPKHRRYNESDSGVAIYAGSRQVDGHSLALLKRGEEVMVLPIDEATARRMQRLALGDPSPSPRAPSRCQEGADERQVQQRRRTAGAGIDAEGRQAHPGVGRGFPGGGLQSATQFFAHDFGYQAALGRHFEHVYAPWSILQWAGQWYGQYPDAIMRAGSVGMIVTALGLLGLAVTRMVLANSSRLNPYLHGSARWANLKDIQASGLLPRPRTFWQIVTGKAAGGQCRRLCRRLAGQAGKRITCATTARSMSCATRRRVPARASAWWCRPSCRGARAPSSPT